MRDVLLMTGLVALVVGCAPAKPPVTVDELAGRLAMVGVAYDEKKAMTLPSGPRLKFDEGIALIGEATYIELVRIEDDRIFNVAKSAGALLAGIEVAVQRELPGKPEIYTEQPFLIVVRQEPTPGMTAAALDKIFPAAE